MDDFTRVNGPRVEKILAVLDLIEKSAASNRTDATALLAPLRARLAGQPLETPSAAPAPRTDGIKAPAHITLWKEAQTASLHTLMPAYATINARLQDLVDEHKGGPNW